MKSLLLPLLLSLAGCVTNPDGSSGLSPEGQIALETSVRIAVRHAVADSPRAAEKAQNIRSIVVRLQAITSAESTLAALRAEVSAELDRLNLSPLDRADADDLLTLLAVALESRLGPDALQSEGLVRVDEFLRLVLAAIPPITALSDPSHFSAAPDRTARLTERTAAQKPKRPTRRLN